MRSAPKLQEQGPPCVASAKDGSKAEIESLCLSGTEHG